MVTWAHIEMNKGSHWHLHRNVFFTGHNGGREKERESSWLWTVILDILRQVTLVSEPVPLPIKWDLGMSCPGGCEDKETIL